MDHKEKWAELTDKVSANSTTGCEKLRKEDNRRQAALIKTRRKQIICIISDTASESSMLNGQAACKTPDSVCCLGALHHKSSSILQMQNLSVFRFCFLSAPPCDPVLPLCCTHHHRSHWDPPPSDPSSLTWKCVHAPDDTHIDSCSWKAGYK